MMVEDDDLNLHQFFDNETDVSLLESKSKFWQVKDGW